MLVEVHQQELLVCAHVALRRYYGCQAGERSRNLDRSFRNIYIIPSFPTREQHAHSVQNARSRFTKLNQ